MVGEAVYGAIRVMTFNIRCGTAPDDHNSWEVRDHLVIDRICSYRPDVLGVQEALHFQVALLEAALPGYESVGIYRHGGNEGESCKLFIRMNLLAVEDSGTFWLSQTPDKAGSRAWGAEVPRICTWAIVQHRRLHTQLLVANTHFDYHSVRARRESTRVIGDWSKTFLLPILLLGDFNADEGSQPLRLLNEHGLRDAFRVVHPHNKNVATFNGFGTNQSRGKIDHILCSSDFKVHSAAIDATTYNGRFPSDHYPVTASVSLSGDSL